MSKSTKSQHYRYTHRSVAVAGRGSCTEKIYLYPVPPEDALTIESLFTHFQFTFDSAVPSDYRKIEYIAVASERPLFINDQPTTMQRIDLNVSADVNRKVDLKLDLTHLLVKENVGFTSLLSADYEQDNMTLIYVKFPNYLRDTLNVGTIDLWKADSVYTTREIR